MPYPFGSSATPVTPPRKKSEVWWPNLAVNNVLVDDTPINLLALISGWPLPVSGSLAPFFVQSVNKLGAYNDNASLNFKLNLQGNWSGSTTNRSMSLQFAGTNGNVLVASRAPGQTPDIISLFTFFSIDKNGSIATQGTSPIIRSNGANFTIVSCLLIAEQLTSSSEFLLA